LIATGVHVSASVRHSIGFDRDRDYMFRLVLALPYLVDSERDYMFRLMLAILYVFIVTVTTCLISVFHFVGFDSDRDYMFRLVSAIL